MYSRKISRKLNNFESSSPRNSRNRVGNRDNESDSYSESTNESDSQSTGDSYNSDESLSEDDEREVSHGIVGEIYQNKYIILKYLGKGTFSRVWMVFDITTEEFYAMKVIYSKYSEDAEHEIDMYKQLGNKYKNITRYIDSFYIKDEMCIVMELMGICLIDLFRYYTDTDKDNNKINNRKWYDTDENTDLIPISVVKKIFRDLFSGLNELHRKNVVHTDLKPENIMINIYPEKLIKIKNWFSKSGIIDLYKSQLSKIVPDNIADLDNSKRKIIRKKCRIRALNLISDKVREIITEYHQNIYNDKLKEAEDIIEIDDISDIEVDEVNTDELFTMPDVSAITAKIIDLGNAEVLEDIEPDVIQLRCYRPPENVLHDFYNTKADIWTMGCILFETLTGDFLFDIDHETYNDSLDRDKELLVQMYNILGEIPRDDIDRSIYKNDLFDSQTNKLLDVASERFNKKSFSELLRESPSELDEAEMETVLDLFNNIFTYDLRKRCAADEILQHKWLSFIG